MPLKHSIAKSIAFVTNSSTPIAPNTHVLPHTVAVYACKNQGVLPKILYCSVVPPALLCSALKSH